jgi:hypothetical protein
MFKKVVLTIIPMLLFSGFASAKLSEAEMCLKIKIFYNEYIRLVQSTDSDSDEKCIKLIREYCTSRFASTIEDDAKYGMGLDYICCEYVDNVDTSRPLSVVNEGNGDNCYTVIFYADCLQRNGKRHKLKIKLRVMTIDDLISDVKDPCPSQRYVN